MVSQGSSPPRYLGLVSRAGKRTGSTAASGRLLLKQRHNQPEVARFGKRAAGSVERWRKWSFQLDETSDLITELSGSPSQWIGVRKERKLRTYQVTDNETVVEASNSTNLVQGCGWEVAKVSVDKSENEWWSLGFEAFGRETELWQTMMLVTEHILSMGESPILEQADSYGYPKWLQYVGRMRTY
jgi:hypothetical protein